MGNMGEYGGNTGYMWEYEGNIGYMFEICGNMGEILDIRWKYVGIWGKYLIYVGNLWEYGGNIGYMLEICGNMGEILDIYMGDTLNICKMLGILGATGYSWEILGTHVMYVGNTEKILEIQVKLGKIG